MRIPFIFKHMQVLLFVQAFHLQNVRNMNNPTIEIKVGIIKCLKEVTDGYTLHILLG
jgi:hypothetical protein